jgi:hypothetical protein
MGLRPENPHLKINIYKEKNFNNEEIFKQNKISLLGR